MALPSSALRYRALCAVGLLTLLAACAPAPITLSNRFNPDEVAWSKQRGTAVVRGRDFLRTQVGEVRTCAGLPVTLVPRSAYSQEVTMRAYPTRTVIANPDPAADEFIRRTTCDAQGNFVFHDLPAGEWYLGARVLWDAPHGLQQGGIIVLPQVVKTLPNKSTEVIVVR
jgi:hypothetical protein